MGREQLPKLLDIGTMDLVRLGQTVLVLVVFLLGKEIGRLVDVEGDANVLRSVSQISTS